MADRGTAFPAPNIPPGSVAAGSYVPVMPGGEDGPQVPTVGIIFP